MSDELALALVVEEDEDEQTAEEQIELNAEGAFVEGSDIDIQKDVVASGDAEHIMSAATSHPKTEGQKGHINLGDVDAAFEAGDTVTLDILKQKGLVPKKIKRIKILADGELTKPLTVKAHSFSIQAIKMIELTGGMVIKLR
ncbi:MAG: hypothetical protein E7605_09450 [Ruminococcaceae bacterium]|nr:hypothetical protein [Oscillospiraceae bacterium]